VAAKVPVLTDDLKEDVVAYNELVTLLGVELAERVMQATSVNDGRFRRMVAVEALIHAIVLLVAIPDLNETHEQYDEFCQHVCVVTMEELGLAKSYGHLAIDYDPQEITWDESSNSWKTQRRN
jgi:hypothetical protein